MAEQQGVEKYFFSIKKGVSKDWKDLADCLGLWDEVGNIHVEGRNRDDESCCRDMLGVWKTRKGDTATMEVLMEALVKARLKDVVETLKREYPELQVPRPSISRLKRKEERREQTPAERSKKLRTEYDSEDGESHEEVDMQKYFDKVITKVSNKWDDLARKLGFNENEIKGIDTVKPDQDRRCREVLHRWRSRKGSEATLQVLQQALIDIDETETAESLEGQHAYRTDTREQHVREDERNNKVYRLVERSEKIFHEEVLRDPERFSKAVNAFERHAHIVLNTDESSYSDVQKLSERAKLTIRRKANDEIARVDDLLFKDDTTLHDTTIYDGLTQSFQSFEATLGRITRGCILCYLEFDDESCQKTFHRAYRDGRLSDTLTRELITDDMRAAEGEDLYVHVTLLGEDGECQDDSLSDEEESRLPTARSQVESTTSGFPDIFIKQEPLSPVKTEPTPNVPSCSYSGESEHRIKYFGVSVLKSQEPPDSEIKTELLDRQPSISTDLQNMRSDKSTEPLMENVAEGEYQKGRKGKRKRKRRRKSDHFREEDSSEESTLSVKVDIQEVIANALMSVSPKWEDLARKLEFDENEIKGIGKDEPDQDHRCREMLHRWRNRKGRKATLQVLKQALINIGERLTAVALGKKTRKKRKRKRKAKQPYEEDSSEETGNDPPDGPLVAALVTS